MTKLEELYKRKEILERIIREKKAVSDTINLSQILRSTSWFGQFFRWIKSPAVLIRRLLFFGNIEAKIDDLRYFVPTRFLEKEKKYYTDEQAKAEAKNLLPFLKKQILKKVNPQNRHIILGESGTGKSTFLTKLYVSLSRRVHTNYVVFIPYTSLNDFLKSLEEINFQHYDRLILLLDAFDEDFEAAQNVQTSLETLNYFANKCKALVLSSRSQVLTQTEISKFNLIEKKYKTYYIDLFDIDDAKEYFKEYLKKSSKLDRKNALDLVKSSLDFDQKPMFLRPFLLSKIDLFLVDEKKEIYKYTFQIYEKLLKEWLIREREKIYTQNSKIDTNKLPKDDFFDFVWFVSKNLALFLNLNPFRENSINKEDFPKSLTEDLLIFIAEKRTFLVNDKLKLAFAHKSVLEYILSLLLLEGHIKENEFNFEKYPETKKFYHEMCWAFALKATTFSEKPFDLYDKELLLDKLLENSPNQITQEDLESLQVFYQNTLFNAFLVTYSKGLWETSLQQIDTERSELKGNKEIKFKSKMNAEFSLQYSQFIAINILLQSRINFYYTYQSENLFHIFCELAYEQSLEPKETKKFAFPQEYEITETQLNKLFDKYCVNTNKPKKFLKEFNSKNEEYNSGKYVFPTRWIYEHLLVSYWIECADNSIEFEYKPEKILFNNVFNEELNWIEKIKPFFDQHKITNAKQQNYAYNLFRVEDEFNFSNLNLIEINILEFFPKNNRVKKLYLNKNKLTALPNIEIFSNLEYLNLNENEFTKIEFAEAEKMSILNYVNLSKNKIKTIEGLETLLDKIPNLLLCENSLPKDILKKYCNFEPKMVFVKGGKFTMGSNEGSDDEKPTHDVTLSDFYIGKYEVTIEEYMAFVEDTKGNKPEWLEEGNSYNINENGKNKDYYRKAGMSLDEKDKRKPITGVSWNNAVAYCDWLSKKTNKKYNLLSEAQWEYAAGGGDDTKYVEMRRTNNVETTHALSLHGASVRTKYAGTNNENELGKYAWYDKNSESKTHEVGTRDPNQLGIYDMSGNVWEWCLDTWHGNYENAPKDGSAWIDNSSDNRVNRGGSWDYGASNCRVWYRSNWNANYRNYYLGFRVVLVPSL